MKRFLIWVLIAVGVAALILFCGGCKSTIFEQELPNGVKVRARDSRFLVNTDAGLTASINPTSGIITIKVDVRSGPDAALIEALAKGLAEGAIKAFVPVPVVPLPVPR